MQQKFDKILLSKRYFIRKSKTIPEISQQDLDYCDFIYHSNRNVYVPRDQGLSIFKCGSKVVLQFTKRVSETLSKNHIRCFCRFSFGESPTSPLQPYRTTVQISKKTYIRTLPCNRRKISRLILYQFRMYDWIAKFWYTTTYYYCKVNEFVNHPRNNQRVSAL